MADKRYTVTEVVAAVYCEQKVVLDRLHGASRSASVQAKVDQGVREHTSFELNGYASHPTTLLGKLGGSRDSRCFIASHVFGPSASPTEWLREWRDKVLMATLAGRIGVCAYYLLSPAVVWLLVRMPNAVPAVRSALAALVRRLGGPA